MAYTTIDDPTIYFQTELWSSVDTSIDTINFAPDWVWIKSRTNADGHVLFDIVRGANERLTSSNTTDLRITSDELTSFNSDGYTLGTGDNVNRSGHNYVSWNWKAGGSASSNSDGSITSNVSVSTTAGFSIVSYAGNNTAGATVGHGLSQEPNIMIFKNRNNGSTSWCFYHSAKGTSGTGRLNTSDAFGDTAFITTTPSSSVFTLTATTIVNENNMIAYCFAEKKGYSKFGSYTGNGNVDGTFVYTGFKPAMIIIKKNGAGDNYHIYDNKVNPTNVMDTNLRPNLNDAEITNANHNLDFVSNGFKWRTTSNTRQGSGSEVIYMAFAESPFVNSNGVPTNAR